MATISHASRRQSRKLCFASLLLAAVAVMGSPARALERPYPPVITPPAAMSTIVVPDTLVIDDRIPMTKGPHWPKFWDNEQELRMREKRQGNNNDDEEDDQDPKFSAETNSEEVTETRTEEEEEEETTATQTEDEEEEPEETATTTEDSDDEEGEFTTMTVSLAPSSTDVIPSDSPLPEPFDDALSSDFQSQGGDDSCPNFINTLLSDATFNDCYPLSMMYWTSTSFFNARRSLVATVRVLEATCAADLDTCSQFMTAAATNLTMEENCEEEYNSGLSQVMEAHRGLLAYETMYTVSCLQDPDTDTFCFANAVTNLSTPSDAQLYFLPFDLSLPGSSTPTCNFCNQETMKLYHAASADRSQPISNTYEDAARQMNTICGPGFVNSTLPEAEESVGRATFLPSWAIMAVSTCVAAAIISFI